MPPQSLREIRELYKQGVNIMRFFRESEMSSVNSAEAIVASYDLQSGSYIKQLCDPSHAQFVEDYTSAIARILDRYEPHSILEAGVGEATTLANVLGQMRHKPLHALGFDISWSRLAAGREFVQGKRLSAQLFLGELAEIPIETDSIDVVYTSHSVEPNRGRERLILKELSRITRKYLILLEPSNELGTDETKQHIEEHKYCLDLYGSAGELGLEVIEHRLFDHIRNPRNQTALIIIRKPDDPSSRERLHFFACPICQSRLVLHREAYFCEECLLAYPILAGIPCLRRSHAIVASSFLESCA